MDEQGGKCGNCGADLTVPGSVLYEETYTGTRVTGYSARMTLTGTLITEAEVAEDDPTGQLDSTVATCVACGEEVEIGDLEYGH